MRSLQEIRGEARKAHEEGDTERVSELAQEMLELNDPVAEGYSLLSKGLVHERHGEIDEAQAAAHQASFIFEREGAEEGLAHALLNEASLFHANRDLERSIELCQRALEIIERYSDGPGMARAHMLLANIMTFQGDYPNAYEHYRRALSHVEEGTDASMVAGIHSGLGTMYLFIHEFEKSLEHYQKGQGFHLKSGYDPGIAASHANIAGVYFEKGEYALALETMNKCVPILHRLDDKQGLSRAYGNMILGYAALGEVDMAIETLRKHEQLATMPPDSKATLFLGRGDIAVAQGEFEVARELYLNALEIVRDAGVKHFQVEAHRKLRDVSRALNDFDGYVQHNDLIAAISEDIRGQSAMQKLGFLEAERRIEGELRERDKERALLHGTLPSEIADRMLRGEDVTGDKYENASVIFLDIVGFTTYSSSMEPHETSALLAQIFEQIDHICSTNNVTKIKTIGDSYMAVAFDEPAQGAQAALSMMQLSFVWPDGSPVQFRIGIHCGPVVAGVIGTQRMQYDVWGDTVNVASRMESSGEAGRVHCSDSFADIVGSSALRAKDDRRIEVRERGTIDIKGKGPMKTFWLEGA